MIRVWDTCFIFVTRKYNVKEHIWGWDDWKFKDEMIGNLRESVPY